MKNVITILFMLFISICQAQNKNAIKVTYVYPDNKRTLTVTAFRNLSLSELKFKNKPIYETTVGSTTNGEKNEQKTKEEGKEIEVYTYTYTNFNKHISITNENVGFDKNPYLVTDTIDIVWKLINEKKIIEKMECFKAEAIFKGRKYTAWYTQEIPLGIGPWKLVGLPGLIIQVNDVENIINLRTYKIEYLQTAKEIELPKSKLKNISWLTYKKLWVDWKKKTLKGMNTSTDPNVEFKAEIDIPLIEKSIFQ